MKTYEFECNLSEEYKDNTCCDEWGSATLWLNDKQGVEYNFCIDGECNSCAIYKMYYDEETDTYYIVGRTEADPFENKISNESPIAQAILGKKAGEVATVKCDSYDYQVKIVEIMAQ